MREAHPTQDAMDGSLALVETPDGFIRIKFQSGVVPEVERNGATIREVIDVLVARLEGFQKGPFACIENQRALHKLRLAKVWLEKRREDRKRRGVEGRHAK